MYMNVFLECPYCNRKLWAKDKKEAEWTLEIHKEFNHKEKDNGDSNKCSNG